MRSLSLGWVLVVAAPGLAAPPEGVEFFESKVRPVLADHCYSCHGPKKQQAGLRLDTADGVKKGTDEGPIVVPGEPGKSRLLAAVKRGGDYPMPPNKPLPDEAVAALTEWVRLGAPYPADSGVQANPAAAGKDHWAFKPVADPPVPATNADPGSANPIDRFILAKLEEKGLTLSPRADRRTLIRRAYFDLIGLPPTAEQVEAFERDDRPDAFARLVDELLTSPRYGERWGRHWLDVARYADSKGYVFNEERTYPYAYTYRDYAIRAFNEDVPFDRFVLEQIAADKLPDRTDNKPLAALGFLTVGRRFMNNKHDIIDDRIDVAFRGLMGLTVSCARCHDHKFDPVPIADYYSLYGVFAGCEEPKELPVLDPNDRSAARMAFEAEYAAKRRVAEEFAERMFATYLARFRTADAVTAYLLLAREALGKNAAEAEKLAKERNLEPVLLAKWRAYLSAPERKSDPVFAAWLAVEAVPDAQYADKSRAAFKALMKAEGKLSPLIADGIKQCEPDTPQELAEVYGKAIAEAAQPAVQNAPDPAREQLAAVLAPGKGGPTDLRQGMGPEAADKFVPISIKKQWRKLRNEADKFQAESPNAPARAMVLADKPDAVEPAVFLRGNPSNPGPKVPRQFPAVAAGPDRKPFADGSGRLELAKAIVSPDNPLTARVFANRVWMHHFGNGLVRTPSDFGVRSDPPTHPELLDWLAERFVEDGWSVKALHRRIMLSAAYQQVSDITPSLAQADPENRLLARQTRQRLEFEPLWDSMLAAAGRLDPTVGGRPVKLFDKPYPTRRAVYGFIDRQNLPGVLRAFDLASPDQHTPQRFLTTVPQQALFLMNNGFVAEQAKAVVARPDVKSAAGTGEKVKAIYRAVLSRNPTAAEEELAEGFVAGAAEVEKGKLGPWELFAQALLMGNEFAFAD